MSIGNTHGANRLMEHWTNPPPKDAFPLLAGGRTLKRPHKGKDGGGKRMGKRRQWFEDVQP